MNFLLEQHQKCRTIKERQEICSKITLLYRQLVSQEYDKKQMIKKKTKKNPSPLPPGSLFHLYLEDYIILKQLAHVQKEDCGAMVYLALSQITKRSFILKLYLHETNAWTLPEYVIRQIYASSKLLEKELQTKKQQQKQQQKEPQKKQQQEQQQEQQQQEQQQQEQQQQEQQQEQEEEQKNLKLNYPFKKNLQKCLDIEILENATRLVFKFYPFTFDFFFGKSVQYSANTIPDNFIVTAIIQLIQAIETLHNCEIVHRDIKDANICFNKRCGLVLIDFDSCNKDTSGYMRHTLPICTWHTRPPEQLYIEMNGGKYQQQKPSFLSTFSTLCRFESKKDNDNNNHNQIQDDYNNNSNQNNSMEGVYDARQGDWWSAGCVIAQMLLRNYPPLFASDENCSLRMQYEGICAFSADMSFGELSKIKLVRQLWRVTPSFVWDLLCGLLHVDGSKRKPAVDVFLKIVQQKKQE